MEINNARIKDVTVCLDDRDRLSARMKFESHCGVCDWVFILTNPTDAQRLVRLMNYVGVREVKNLNGKIVREVYHDGILRGFGNPIENKFVLTFGKGLNEVTESQFKAILESQSKTE